jgi:hypothetical protein
VKVGPGDNSSISGLSDFARNINFDTVSPPTDPGFICVKCQNPFISGRVGSLNSLWVRQSGSSHPSDWPRICHVT